ncbi:MAG: ABC transporter permease, partial [Acidobacteria bacterium]|nr:ABC transporter permease [Acidobacteriota bacterium]
MAFNALDSHRLRSVLAILGVVIGTAIVMVIGATLTGLDRSIGDLLQRFGTRTILVSKISPGLNMSRRDQELRLRKPLTLADAEAIARSCPAVERVAAVLYAEGMVTRNLVTVRYRGEEVIIQAEHFAGATEDYPRVLNMNIRHGRYFTENENRHRLPLALIGYEIERALFPHENALGKIIEV